MAKIECSVPYFVSPILKSKVRSSGQRQMPPSAGDSVLTQQVGGDGFGVLVVTAADAGHDGRAFGFSENVRHLSNFTSTDRSGQTH